jgi:hypothetical protein
MNKKIKNTKNGGFIKDLQNYQKSQSVIKQQNGTVVKQQNGTVIKQNGTVVKQNGTVIKQQNGTVVKQNGTVIKQQNGTVVEVIGPVVKQNGPVVKQNGTVVKQQNGTVIKQNGSVVKQQNGPVVKQNGPVVKQQNGTVVEVIGPVVKVNNVVGVKGDMDGLGKEKGFDKKNILQQNKNFGLGLKGDMDGLGKEKGNMNPRFVYLYKNKFEMEAVKNKNDMNGLSPLNEYEPTYNPNYWNNNKNIKNNNNCYSYSVNNKNHQFGKPQPGYFARYNHIQNNQYKCAYFFKRILNDIPSVYLTSFKQKCKKGFTKAFFAIDSNKNEHDYHFYRQDNNQLWSHKPGTTNVINYDADYKIIKNPLKANRNYIHYNYDKPCFFFCVNNKFGKTKAKI